MTIEKLKAKLKREMVLLGRQKLSTQRQVEEMQSYPNKIDINVYMSALMDSMVCTARYNAVCYLFEILRD